MSWGISQGVSVVYEVTRKFLVVRGCFEEEGMLNLRNQPNARFHPLRFLGENDPAVSRRLWESVYPALQLASRLLVSAPVMAFPRLLEYGNEVTDTTSAYKIMESSGVEDCPGADGDGQDELMRLSSRLAFVFGAMKPDLRNNNQKHAFFTVDLEDIGKGAYIRCNLPPKPHEFHYIVVNETYEH